MASWPALAALPPLTVADVACAWADVPPDDAATATPLPAATAALTAAAAAMILVLLRT
jgi:hypothetical protein